MKKTLPFALLLTFISCTSKAPEATRMTASSAELPPPELGEIWGSEQEAQAEVILDDMINLMRKRDADKKIMKRDAHPKMHGCAKAYFSITNKDLPKEYRVGIFAKDKSYDAWVRYSNGAPDIAPDIKKDVRGMAIKVMNVTDTPTGSQDFLMINAKEFFSKDGDDYADLFHALKAGSSWAMIKYGVMHPVSAMKLSKGLIQIGNPVGIPYHSSVPYKLGPSPMRFKAEPCGPYDNAIPTGNVSDTYLQSKLIQTLKEKNICFNFFVQPNKDPQRQPVEDPRLAWDETKSPAYQVGTVTLFQQEGIDSKSQQTFCENLSFDPWHTLPETRPMGQINRMRGIIYKEISRVRHENNRTTILEPTNHRPCQGPTAALCE